VLVPEQLTTGQKALALALDGEHICFIRDERRLAPAASMGGVFSACARRSL
jgi:hypothetical protein